MKKIIMLVSFVSVVFALVGCSSCNSPCTKAAEPAPCQVHHDLKGECN